MLFCRTVLKVQSQTHDHDDRHTNVGWMREMAWRCVDSVVPSTNVGVRFVCVFGGEGDFPFL